MEDLDIIDGESQYVANSGGGLPVFLKVLCILTYVGSGLGILGAIFGLMTRRLSETNFKMMQRLGGDDAFGLMGIDLEQMIKWQTYMNIANLIGAGICLTGALLMWKLKKTGFYIYVPGALIPVIVGGIGMQYIMTGFMSGFGTMGVVLNGMISAAFIIMYGVNYKHLR